MSLWLIKIVCGGFNDPLQEQIILMQSYNNVQLQMVNHINWCERWSYKRERGNYRI